MNEWNGVKAFAKGIGLFLIIAAGVTVGNILSTYLMAAASLKALTAIFSEPISTQAPTALQQPTTHQQPRPRIQTPSQAVEQISRETKRKREISDRLNQTCNFWIAEYNKTRKALDKAHRDVACRDAGRPFN